MTRVKRYFRPVLFSVGFIFLINGNINIIDVLPDVIGWLIIAAALTGFSDLDHRMEQARRNAFWLAMVSASKYLMLITIDVFDNDSNVLMLSFSYCVIETILLVSFTIKFFTGLSYLVERNSDAKMLRGISTAETFTVMFFLAKCILGCLPDFTALFNEGQFADVLTNFGYYNIQSLKNTIVIIDFALITLLGIAWLTVCQRTFSEIAADKQFIETLEGRYSAQVLSDPLVMCRRDISRGFTLLCGGCASLCFVGLQHVSCLPEFVSVGLICAGGRILSRRYLPFKGIIVPAIPAAVLSSVSFVYDIYYSQTQMTYGGVLYRFLFEQDIVRRMSNSERTNFEKLLGRELLSVALYMLALAGLFAVFMALKKPIVEFCQQNLGQREYPDNFLRWYTPILGITCVMKLLAFAEPFNNGFVSFIFFTGITLAAIYFTLNMWIIMTTARERIR